MRHTVSLSRLRLLAMTLLWLCSLAIGACGSSNGYQSSNEVDMGAAKFMESSIIIQAGQSVQFVDPEKSGGVHVLCIGENSLCVPQAGAPPQLNVSYGIQVMPGDPPIDVTFSTKGTYVVVCIIHPGMAVTIDVK
ncbi:MAG: hypothetical protein ACLQUY_28935 [Ktedonobacterales bacterium]